MKHTVLFLIVLLFESALVSAQTFNMRMIRTDAATFPRIEIVLQAYDSFDEPLKGLNAAQFSVAVDGMQAQVNKIDTYEQINTPIQMMLVVDVSGSEAGAPLLAIKSAVKTFISHKRNIDKIGLLAIADDAVLVSDFSQDTDVLLKAVDGMKVEGTRSAIYYTIANAVNRLVKYAGDEPKIVIVMSDGKNESTAGSFRQDDVIKLANDSQIPIFSLGYSKIDKSYLQTLERISELTHGNYYEAPEDKDLEQVYMKIYRQIANIYSLHISVFNVKGDGLEHTATVTLNNNGASVTSSLKFITPASGAFLPLPEQIEPLMVYYLAGGAALVITAVVVTVVLGRRRRKTRYEEKVSQSIELKKKEDEVKTEREKREILEKKIIDSSLENKRGQDNKTKTETPTVQKSRKDRTMILSPSDTGNINETHLRFEILAGELSGLRFEVGPDGATIGKSEDNSIVIAEPTVSRHHARFLFANGLFILEDADSTNGTFVNGVQVSKKELSHGDAIKIGRVEGIVTYY